MRNGLLTVSFDGTRQFFTSKSFDVTVPQPCVPITIFFLTYQVQLKDLNQFVSDGFEILQMISECIHLCMVKIWEPV